MDQSTARRSRGDGTAAQQPPGAGTADPGPACGGDTDLPGRGEGWIWGDEGAVVPADAPLPALMSVALRLLGAFFDLTAQASGVSAAGLAVLRLLAARDGLKSSEVAARGWWTPGTVTSLVDTLVRDGYVERRRDQSDRRVVRLHLTGRGRSQVMQTVAGLAPRWRDAMDYVDPADEPVIRTFLLDTIERFGTLVQKERGN